jgi:hypothetical protein
MARKITGLYRRGDVWWLRQVVPQDVSDQYHSPLIRFSLGTTDAEAARVLALQHHARFAKEVDEHRARAQPMKVGRVSPELAQILAANARQTILQADENLRLDPEVNRFRSLMFVGSVNCGSWLRATGDTS